MQSTLSFQRDISCIALYYTIHSTISGRDISCIIQSTLPFQGDISCIALYYTIHSYSRKIFPVLTCTMQSTLSFQRIFPVLPCIIQSTLPFQGEIFPVLYNPLYHFREIFPVLPCIIQSTLIPERYFLYDLYYAIHSIISERYFLYCPVLYNPLYHFRERYLYYTIHSYTC